MILHEGKIQWFDENSGEGAVEVDHSVYRFYYVSAGGKTYVSGEPVRVHLRQFHDMSYVEKIYKANDSDLKND